ncbi:hypothetical protein HanRHA438_Chr13g0578701 [Helianthus annuus]|nr:hypothetical protein HanRHA438_Chr13g0578701 [Helianthus annuus]
MNWVVSIGDRNHSERQIMIPYSEITGQLVGVFRRWQRGRRQRRWFCAAVMVECGGG